MVQTDLKTDVAAKSIITVGGTYTTSNLTFNEIIYDVTIANVERGDGLPYSICPGSQKSVSFVITPSLANTGHNIAFDIINYNATNGTATIVGQSTFTDSGSLNIAGGSQTTPNNGGNIKIRAKADGNTECDTSDGFSICAHMINFMFNVSIPNGSTLYAGYTWQSDTGNLQDLDKGRVVENVTYNSPDHWYQPPAPFTGVYENPSADNASGGVSGGIGDSHSASFATPYVAGSFTAAQKYKWICDRCGCNIVVYSVDIIRTVAYDTTFNAWKYSIVKGPASIPTYWLP